MAGQTSPTLHRFPWEKLHIASVGGWQCATTRANRGSKSGALGAVAWPNRQRGAWPKSCRGRLRTLLPSSGRSGTLPLTPSTATPRLPSQRQHPTRNYRSIRVRADTRALCSLSILCKGVRDRNQREKSLVCSTGRL